MATLDMPPVQRTPADGERTAASWAGWFNSLWNNLFTGMGALNIATLTTNFAASAAPTAINFIHAMAQGSYAAGTPEGWHAVDVPAGVTGEPKFQNNWVAYGAGEETTAFVMDADGKTVWVKGAVKNGTLATAVIFTLPAGYRPAAKVRFGCESNGAAATLTIDSNGNVAGSAGVSTLGIHFCVSFKVAGR
ncbi:MAG: hypothetical protein OEV94_12050 [Deltaproteobacteria bacterium]|nr:hypothetical protein [Deltaproteobacteria bacterium]